MTTVPVVSAARSTVAIHSDNLCRHYRMGETLIRAVDGVSFEVRSGEFVALLGSSGSGKSSMLNLIAGLDSPTSGSVVVQDRDLAKLSREELAKYRLHVVGMVFQSFNLISSMTLAENVELPLRFAEVDRSKRDDLAREALERVGLRARMDHRPSQLSGGEQQSGSFGAGADQPSAILTGRRTYRKSRQPHWHRNHGDGSPVQSRSGNDYRDGDARARAGRALRAAHDFLADGKLMDDQPNTPQAKDSRGESIVKIPDLTELALRNLRESLLRNSLTTVGISVGVASLVAMLSLGIGLQQMASRRLAKSGLFDTVVVTSRRDMRGMGRERMNETAPRREKAAFSTKPLA
jgi:ABC-type lipoprotein export system ATPase subunit